MVRCLTTQKTVYANPTASNPMNRNAVFAIVLGVIVRVVLVEVVNV